MRTNCRSLSLSVSDGNAYTFRLSKPDAFTGAGILRLLLKHLPEGDPSFGPSPDLSESWLRQLFISLSDSELRSLMTASLEHTEVLLDAGYHPVLEMGEWSWLPLREDTAACLKLTLESVLFTLSGFFAAAGSTSPADPAAP